MPGLTYDLRAGDHDSDCYSRDISSFTDVVRDELLRRTVHIAHDNQFQVTQASRRRRTSMELGLELLVLGTLWRVHGSGRITTHGFDQLVTRLDVMGEYAQEVIQLRRWSETLAQSSSQSSAKVLRTSVDLASWFEPAAETALGRYTQNVRKFLNEVLPQRPPRPDHAFCGRQPVEYHVNMVGAELLNRVYRPEFLRARRKAVLLPACLCARPTDSCKARQLGFSLRCRECDASCRVARLTRVGRHHGFEVVLFRHGSGFTSWSGDRALSEGVAIVGVACTLSLISGGWQAREAGIPAQCVVLDTCGCPAHWEESSRPTDLNEDELLRILGLSSVSDTIPPELRTELLTAWHTRLSTDAELQLPKAS